MPKAFAESKFSRAASAVTSDSDKRMLDSRWFVRGWAVSAGEFDVASEKTERRNEFKRFALHSLSVIIFWQSWTILGLDI